ncbi:MAG: hypothetical protein U0667_09005 [Chloroflexota bacterium]
MPPIERGSHDPMIRAMRPAASLVATMSIIVPKVGMMAAVPG